MNFQPIVLGRKLSLSEDRKKELKLKNEVTFFDSRFEFLRSGCGLRPGKVHLFLGTTGTGKSTLVRSIQMDCAKQYPILVYSVEEDIDDTEYLIEKRGVDEKVLNNIFFLDESSILKHVKPNDPDALFDHLAKIMIENGCRALFFDNLTTAFYEGKRPGEQVAFYNGLKAMITRLNVPLVLVAHTKDGVKDSQGELICPSDIRNSKHPSNRSEYLYIFQRFNIKRHYGKEDLVAVIRVIKARLHDNASTTYVLGFDSVAREYKNDKLISFDNFNEIFKQRLRLGMK